MKLDRKNLKQLIREALSDKDSVLLESPVAEATMQSVSDKVSPTARPERTSEEFLVMTSDRGERDKPNWEGPSNKEMYNKFIKQVEAYGLQYTTIAGGWEETDQETGEKRDVRENSLIIYKESRPDKSQTEMGLFEIGKLLSGPVEKGGFDQEAFIYGELFQSKSGQSRRVIAAYDRTGADAGYGQWSSMEAVTKDADFWSAVKGGGKGSPFQFKEGKEVIEIEAPNSVIEAMKLASESPGKRLKFIRRKR